MPQDFSKTKLSTEIINFIVELSPNQKILLEWVLISKGLSEEDYWLGSNAANILLKLDRSALKGKNLANCTLPEVNFENAELTQTIFFETDVRESKFNHTIHEGILYENCISHGVVISNSDESFEVRLESIKKFKGSKHLDLSYYQIKNLKGIEEFSELSHLQLKHSSVVDFTSLKYCTGLSYLGLGNTNFKKYKVVKGA